MKSLLGTVVIPRLAPSAESQSDSDAEFSHDEDTPDFDDLRDLDASGDILRDVPRSRPPVTADENSGDLTVTGVTLPGGARNRQATNRRPARAKSDADPDTAVLRRLDSETLREMDSE